MEEKLTATIKAERKSQGLTQKMLAKKTARNTIYPTFHLSQGTIARAEKYAGDVKLDTLFRIVTALGKELIIK